MARIKVTGYMDTDDIDPDVVDLSHEMGLTDNGYVQFCGEIPLDDLTFELESE